LHVHNNQIYNITGYKSVNLKCSFPNTIILEKQEPSYYLVRINTTQNNAVIQFSCGNTTYYFIANPKTVKQASVRTSKKKWFYPLIGSCAAVILLLIGFAVYQHSKGSNFTDSDPDAYSFLVF